MLDEFDILVVPDILVLDILAVLDVLGGKLFERFKSGSSLVPCWPDYL